MVVKPVVTSITSNYLTFTVQDQTQYLLGERANYDSFLLVFNYSDNSVNGNISGINNGSGAASQWTATASLEDGEILGEVWLILYQKGQGVNVNTMTPEAVYALVTDPDNQDTFSVGYTPILLIPDTYTKFVLSREQFTEAIINNTACKCLYKDIYALYNQLSYAASLRKWDIAEIAFANLKNQFV